MSIQGHSGLIKHVVHMISIHLGGGHDRIAHVIIVLFHDDNVFPWVKQDTPRYVTNVMYTIIEVNKDSLLRIVRKGRNWL